MLQKLACVSLEKTEIIRWRQHYGLQVHCFVAVFHEGNAACINIQYKRKQKKRTFHIVAMLDDKADRNA